MNAFDADMRRRQRKLWNRLQRQLWHDRIQQEARIANDLQHDHPDMTRSRALRLAALAMEKP